MSGEQVTVQADTREFREALESLTEFLELTLQVCDGVLHLLDAPGDLLSVQLYRPAAPDAHPLRAAFEPTQRLRDLVTAVRAGNVQLHVIKEAAHATAYPATAQTPEVNP
ncbi:hypothetical protein GCM10017784_35410 [Deinococcus indicus]|nr:hypothetical protein GCM10017784_35410 [Deinococcus indicus]